MMTREFRIKKQKELDIEFAKNNFQPEEKFLKGNFFSIVISCSECYTSEREEDIKEYSRKSQKSIDNAIDNANVKEALQDNESFGYFAKSLCLQCKRDYPRLVNLSRGVLGE